MTKLKRMAANVLLHRWFPAGYMIAMVGLLIAIFALLGG